MNVTLYKNELTGEVKFVEYGFKDHLIPPELAGPPWRKAGIFFIPIGPVWDTPPHPPDSLDDQA